VTRNGYGWLTWSADGKQIAFATGAPASHGPEPSNYRGIGVVDADGRHFHLATGNAYNEYPAVWSPKGHQLLYGRANKGGTYVIGSNGRNDHRVTSDSPTGSLWPALAWSPDGNSIVYATPTGNGNLYILGADGHGKVDLTNTPDSDLAPSWVAR
jgi:Tol biopolymer transport system component